MPFPLSLLILILPLGLDTLGVSLSLGMRSASREAAAGTSEPRGVPLWLRTAALFALAETLMPIVGLLIGAALSSLLSEWMHYLGALLLIGLGGWECLSEGREYFRKRCQRQGREWTKEVRAPDTDPSPARPAPGAERFRWGQQFLLALSVSLDELAVGFSFGALKSVALNPFVFCLFVGLQGFLMAVLGIAAGRALRFRLKMLQEGSELLSAALLIALGVWFLFT
jgi:putative Mn2+ efflux pump MntP